MSDFRQVFVVQDRCTGEFLCPSVDGDVGFTMYLSEAGKFYEVETAIETAELHLDDDYKVSTFYERCI